MGSHALLGMYPKGTESPSQLLSATCCLCPEGFAALPRNFAALEFVFRSRLSGSAAGIGR